MPPLSSGPPPDWKRVSQLVADALERPSHERDAWLATMCGGDEDLRREVAALLAAEAQAGAFLERAAVESTGAADLVSSRARESLGLVAGRRVGPYQIIRELGHGGMGAVYLAARADLACEKQVAVKVVRAAASATRGNARKTGSQGPNGRRARTAGYHASPAGLER